MENARELVFELWILAYWDCPDRKIHLTDLDLGTILPKFLVRYFNRNFYFSL